MEWSDLTEENLEAATSPEIFRRGIEYFHEGHLVRACFIGNQISGIITGTGGDYKVRLWLEGSQLKGDCSCPYPEFCKHMIALGLAWLKEKASFIDIQPQLMAILKNPETQNKTLFDLVHKDPINFLMLFPDLVENHFINNRGIANLIRNTFNLPQMTLMQAEALWEKIERVEQLIHQKAQAGDSLAFPLLLELFSGYENAFVNYHSEKLIELWKNEIHSVVSLIDVCPQHEIAPIFDKICSLYLDPNLWELSADLRELIWKLHRRDSEFLFCRMNDCFFGEPSLLILISLYILISEAPIDDSRFSDCLDRIITRLTATVDGSIWLIDRWSELNLDKGYQLAKKSLYDFPEEQVRFRERLIIIHQKRSEYKQAAALSFIQFQANPNFEEYCRLKGLLINAPDDWGRYHKRILEILSNSSDKLLLLQIMVEDGDFQGTKDNLPMILGDELLLTAAVSFLGNRIQKDFIEFYPCFIKELLLRQSPAHWNSALDLMVHLKRYCLHQDGEEYLWAQLRKELQQIYKDDAKFLKKFASILSEANELGSGISI
jgi:hypothetical protein